MKSFFNKYQEDKDYKQSFFGTLGVIGIAAAIGAGVACTVAFTGPVAAITAGALFGAAAKGAFFGSLLTGGIGLFFGPWVAIATAFIRRDAGDELGGVLHASAAGLVASAAMVAAIDGPQIMRDRFPTPEQRVVTAANKAFECNSNTSDVQVQRNRQGEPVSVTVTCRP